MDSIDLKTSTNKNILLLFAALLISSVSTYYFIAPLYKELRIAKLEIELKNDSIDLRKSLLSNIEKYNSESADIDIEEIKKLDSLIPNGNNYEEYLLHISDAARNRNIIIGDFSVSDVSDAKDKTANRNVYKRESNKSTEARLKTVRISFSAWGDFANFVGFLQAIENGIPLAQIESLSLESDIDETNKEKKEQMHVPLNYKVNLVFYHY